MSKDLQNVLDEMKQIGVLNGRYDAKNGTHEFMYGIWFVMDYLTNQVSQEYHENFMSEFSKNYFESIDKV